MHYTVYSPDEIPIQPEPFKTEEAAQKGLIKWMHRFQRQGHYFTAKGVRIPLGELKNHCRIIAQ